MSEAAAVAQVFQRDDGLWSIGWHDDAAGPFESRAFAEAVAFQHPTCRVLVGQLGTACARSRIPLGAGRLFLQPESE